MNVTNSDSDKCKEGNKGRLCDQELGQTGGQLPVYTETRKAYFRKLRVLWTLQDLEGGAIKKPEGNIPGSKLHIPGLWSAMVCFSNGERSVCLEPSEQTGE